MTNEREVLIKIADMAKLAAQAAAVPAMQPREHETSADCWCYPEIDYTDPVTGVSVYVHKEPQ